MADSSDLDNAKILSTLSYETLRNLSLRLNIVSPLPVDWRALAGVLGFSSLVISNIEGTNARGDKTQWLLEVWERCTDDASVKKLILALAYLDLQACLDIVKRDKNIQEASFDEAMETYRMKSKLDGWERTVFGSIKDEAVDLWATQAMEKKVVIEMRDKEERESQQKADSSSYTYPEYRPTSTAIVKDTVFISYNKDDPNHHQNVLELSKWLSRNGYTVFCMDFYEEEIGKVGIQKWTEEKYSIAEHVLLIGSRGYIENCQNRTSHVSFDYFLLSNELVCKNNLNNKRVIVILMDEKQHRHVVPQLFLPFPPAVWPRQKSDLLRRLQNIPKYEKPKVGKKKLLTSIVEKF